ncbi:MAG: hypothetical protein NC920_02725, partial [Candidatus Omnitrophica bacterium]|nr:hypothetical protein [Candidatus Omnitrophota bacterium]
MLEYLLCLIIRFLSFWVSLFPISFSLFLARCLGTVSYYLFSKKAKLAYLNLKLAFEEEISFERRKRIIKELFRNLLMNLVEFLYFPDSGG